MMGRLRRTLDPPVVAPPFASPAPRPTPPPPFEGDPDKLRAEIARHSWYHAIEVAPGIFTPPVRPEFQVMWDFNMRGMELVDFRGRRVLDVGCRDGLFSFEAERRGAAEVLGIDNDLSTGAVEFLLPHFRSKVVMTRLNLYDLDPAAHGGRDIIIFFGVLYHLRYPVWGLKKVADCLAPGGRLLLESGMLRDTRSTRDLDIMMCPVEDSPYEITSCTFFNRRGLVTTMGTLGLRCLAHMACDDCLSPSRGGRYEANRQIFLFEKPAEDGGKSGLTRYWDDTHSYHTAG